MLFKLFGKRKKYPFNKQKHGQAVGVYAGPEYFRRLSGQPPEDPVLDVYAGPEFFERQTNLPEEDERFNTVYAGPEPPTERAALVYAGPEFFARRQSGHAPAPVYAGPEPDAGMRNEAPPFPEKKEKADPDE